jgi:hypothetical protein
MGFGGGQDENHVRRRLLQRLQQGVKSLGGYHVRLVQNIYLHARSRRREDDALTQIPYIVHAVVGSGVYLDNVNGSPLGYLPTRATVVTGIRGGAFLTVQSLSQDSSRAGLAGAPRACEEIRMGQVAVAQ